MLTGPHTYTITVATGAPGISIADQGSHRLRNMSLASFPVISFQEFLTGSEVEKRAVAQKLYNAFHEYGWVYLQDFGITSAEIDEMFAMVSPTFEDFVCWSRSDVGVWDSLRSILSGR